MAIPSSPNPIPLEDDRTSVDVETLRRSLTEHLYFLQGRLPETASQNDFYLALAYTIRDRLMPRWLQSNRTYYEPESRVVCYLSAEFLLGRHLENNLINLGIREPVRKELAEANLDLQTLIDQEEEPGLAMGAWGDWPPAIWIPCLP